MKRLLLHVGYPKAASTTLQNGLFLSLHAQGMINFLGRAFESDFYGIKQDRGEYKRWFKGIVEHRDAVGSVRSLGDLAEDKVNLLSEGLFMMNERHTEQLTGPKLLHQYFVPCFDQVEVLLIIRAQTSLVQSYYVHNHRKMEISDFSRYIDFNLKKGWPSEAKIFNFYSVISEYAAAFGKEKVRVLFFEELLHDRPQFATKLAKALDIAPASVEANLGENQLNRTRKDDREMVVRKLDKRSWRATLIKTVEKRYPKWAELLRIRFPQLTDEQKKAIFDSFKNSNQRLADEFGLDKLSMQKYGYF